ncbi:hypothetical protein [Scytonema sp. PRP1]|uniref:hypothetical protein n=1 Tax=Scytonema sp. PRP1 TaxID=3120513 RepID=UPI002FD6D22D
MIQPVERHIASNGRGINANMNTLLNIGKKAILNLYGHGIKGLVVAPIRVTPNKAVA